MKIPQSTIALPFLTHNVSAIGGVFSYTSSTLFNMAIGVVEFSNAGPKPKKIKEAED